MLEAAAGTLVTHFKSALRSPWTTCRGPRHVPAGLMRFSMSGKAMIRMFGGAVSLLICIGLKLPSVYDDR
jgi:hypothetical protein